MAIKTPAKKSTAARSSKPKAARATPAIRRVSNPAAASAAVSTISVDYPLPGETLTSFQYTIRVSAEGAQSAEVSINGGEWLPCRSDAGYWWYDWTLLGPGPHSIVAQMQSTDGTWHRSAAQTCYCPG